MKNDIASSYRLSAVQSATPVGLVVLLYDGALQSFHRAQRAMEANNVEQRVEELNRALSIIGMLQSALDYSRGGEVARQLGRFYDLASAKILEASIKASPPILRELAAQFFSLREAWEQVERANGGAESQPGPVPTVPPAIPAASYPGV